MTSQDLRRALPTAVVAAVLTMAVAALPAPSWAANWSATLAPEEGSVVRITTATSLFDNQWVTGSGFWTHGVIVTCYHVIAHAHYHIDVWFPGRHSPYYAYVVSTDPAQDLALLQLDVGGGMDPGDLPLAGKIQRLGETVAVAGHPQGVAALILTTGELVSRRGVVWVENYGRMRGMLVLHGGIHPGDSGGPVFNAQGQVIGVAEDATQGSDVGRAIPVYRVESLLAAAGY